MKRLDLVAKEESRSRSEVIREARKDVYRKKTEMERVLSRLRFRFLKEQIIAFMMEIQEISALIVPDEKVIGICRDSKDHIILNVH